MAAIIGVVGLLWLLAAGNALLPFRSTVTLKGVMASKADFFEDAEVQRLLLKHHIRVEPTRHGSREVALEVTTQETDQYDFAFPPGQPAVNLIQNDRARENKHNRSTKLFTSPVVLASYREYAETLVRNHVAEPRGDAGEKPLYYTLDTAEFMKLGERGNTWNSIGLGDHTNESGERITNGNRVLADRAGRDHAAGAGQLGTGRHATGARRTPRGHRDQPRHGLPGAGGRGQRVDPGRLPPRARLAVVGSPVRAQTPVIALSRWATGRHGDHEFPGGDRGETGDGRAVQSPVLRHTSSSDSRQNGETGPTPLPSG